MFSLPIQLNLLGRLLLSGLLGAGIGYERSSQRKSAGLKTHVMVAIASALFTIVSKYGFSDGLHSSYDPSRIASLVVTGISFIGAGTIIVHKEQISGLNTAASLWATAAVGVAMGSGLVYLGISGAVLILLIQYIFRDDRLERWVKNVSLNLQIEANNQPEILSLIKSELNRNQVRNISVKIIDVTDEKIVFACEGVIDSAIDENTIIMNLCKYPELQKITYSPGSK